MKELRLSSPERDILDLIIYTYDQYVHLKDYSEC